MRTYGRAVVAGMLAVATTLAGAQSKDVNLPDTLAITGYGTGAASYVQMVSIGNLLRNEYGVSVRVLPGDTDIARMTPLRDGRVSLCGCGIAKYFAYEGVGVFATPDWGPQDLRKITASTSEFGMVLAVAADTGVKTPADLRGKRVTFVRGADALNISTEAYLAFGGLTWDDVEKVVFPGYGSAFEGVLAGRADTVFTTTISPYSQQLASSRRGAVWPKLDPEDTEGWARMRAVAPYFVPHEATEVVGDGYGAHNPWIGSTYPYPIIVGNSDLDEDIAYALIKITVEHIDQLKGAAPGNSGYALERLTMKGTIPFYDSVIEYFQEVGHWTEDMQAHQDYLKQRGQIIRGAWASFMESKPPADAQQFRTAWYAARVEALEGAGMDPIFR
jgi:TRAP transporter TAXI family solute receptor